MLKNKLSGERRAYILLMKVLMLFSVAITAALVLFLFIMLINAALNAFLKGNKEG